ncbi:hypothetical protein SAMN05661093_10680 [Kibdelosporangium aridum]|uniref:Uncharacterized protein n=1 Tax=Kibdelosporangium aridum TaxID=2030 RepID=A0A1Y5Y8E5_KIBAR|nr:hypothetical protein SAMN05661093_10680 [Kibdelosporangium aridum]
MVLGPGWLPAVEPVIRMAPARFMVETFFSRVPALMVTLK